MEFHPKTIYQSTEGLGYDSQVPTVFKRQCEALGLQKREDTKGN